MKYGDMNKEQAEVIFEKELRNFKKIQGEELSLDMSRGKPCTAQLDLANAMFDMVNANASFITEMAWTSEITAVLTAFPK